MDDLLVGAEERPAGSSFKYKGKTYHVQPRTLSSRVIDALARLWDMKFADQKSQLIGELRSCIGEDQRNAVYDIYGYCKSRFEKTQAMLDDPEGIATVLHLCCDEIKDYDQAKELVDDYPNFIDLVMAVTEASGLKQLGN